MWLPWMLLKSVKKATTMRIIAGAVAVLLVFCILSSHLQQHTVSMDGLFRRLRLFGSLTACPRPGAGSFTLERIKSTALVSFPGSGNTWTRHLLTTATGVMTASFYSIEKEVSIDNRQRAYRVMVTKTHEIPSVTRGKLPVDRGILLIRNPYEALLAEFNREAKPSSPYFGHTAIRTATDFQTVWPQFVSRRMNGWQYLHLVWANETLPLHVLVYSRMLADLHAELTHVIHFLNVTSVDLTIDCAVRHSKGNAHRKKQDWQDKVAVYSREQKLFLNEAIDKVEKALEIKTKSDFSDFQQWKR